MVSHDTKNKAVNGKTSTMTSRSSSRISVAAEYSTSSVSADSSPAMDSSYSKFHHLKRILEKDSSGDNSSLISSNSDEGSCSTDSTYGSTSIDSCQIIFSKIQYVAVVVFGGIPIQTLLPRHHRLLLTLDIHPLLIWTGMPQVHLKVSCKLR